jgi:hypothetical protein
VGHGPWGAVPGKEGESGRGVGVGVRLGVRIILVWGEGDN